MTILESIKMSLSSILSNKLRSGLTMLGVIIGVAAVISLVAIGTGARADITAQVESLGSNLITVTPQGIRLTVDDAYTLKEQVNGISAVMPTLTRSARVRWNERDDTYTVQGTVPEQLWMQSLDLGIGRFIAKQDVDRRAAVAVIGENVATELLGRAARPGEKIRISGRPFTVIGILSAKGAGGLIGGSPDDCIQIPISTATRLFGQTSVDSILLQANGDKDARLVTAHIERIYESQYGEGKVRVFSQEQLLATINSVTATLTLMLGGIAAISLLVGGIGIMNIMLVSVTERTREIGIREALGARQKDILMQFLVESTVVSVMGGLIGIVLGILGARLIGSSDMLNTVVSPGWVLLAFGFAAAVGIIFGLWPSVKAARLDPIEALRHE